jgi:ribonuclease HII
LEFLVAGVDEAGRGPLAGPVVAAAVILDPRQSIDGLADSKTLAEHKRNSLYKTITHRALSWSIAEASVEEIDDINILQATLLAMKRAVHGLSIQPDKLLVDGIFLPDCLIPGEAIIKGDSKVQAISAASILAKVHRDQLMVEYHNIYPNFSFHAHKGYGTKQHLSEIEQFGVLDVHRRTFNPVKSLIGQFR